MSDAEIIDWMQENYVSLVLDAADTYEMTYIGGNGANRKVRAASLRACVVAAAARSSATK